MAILLILVFVVSVGTVVAEDTADVSDELAVDNVDQAIEVTEDADETLGADEEAETLQANQDEEPLDPADDFGDDMTSIGIRVDVLDKNIKAGDNFRVKITVENWGENPAENVVAGFSFVDALENLDSSVKLVSSNGYALTSIDGGFFVEFGFIGAGDTKEAIITFMSTENGQKMIVAAATADNVIMEPDNYCNTTFTVGDSSVSSSSSVSNNNDNKNKVSSAKTAATGNPLALLGLALFGLVPYCRRD